MSPKVSKEHLEQRRAKILEAATHVFIEHGYERTTMKHVMDAAEVSRGGLYQYFSNKEDLFEAILADRLFSDVAKTDQLLKERVDSYWDLLLSRIFGESKEPSEHIDPLAASNLEFFITGRNDQHRRSYAQERYSFALKLYANIIEAGQQSGEFSTKQSSEMIARSIITFIDGLALDNAILPKEDIKLKEQSSLLIEYLRLALEVKAKR
jgi:TetR/AcrR family transcriptional regulator, transcriptional repressor of aconitase